MAKTALPELPTEMYLETRRKCQCLYTTTSIVMSTLYLHKTNRYTPTHEHPHPRACMYVSTYTCTYTHIHTYTYVHTYTHTHKHTHVHTHTDTNMHTHTRTHTYTPFIGFFSMNMSMKTSSLIHQARLEEIMNNIQCRQYNNHTVYTANNANGIVQCYLLDKPVIHLT